MEHELQANRLSGLFVGQCKPEEYEHLVEAGVLRIVYEGAAGFLGLGKFRSVARIEETTP